MTDDLPPLARHYCSYLEALASVAWPGDLADYDWGRLPSRLSGAWLAYAQMFDDFSREIANSINQLILSQRRLSAWEIVLANVDEPIKHELSIEFVDPLATLALNLPAVIRDRFIFASAHLSHQANLARDGADWRDDLPDDRRIRLVHVERYGSKWSANPAFIEALKQLASQADYEASTANFRNMYNHRFPVRILTGLSSAATRNIHPETHRPYYAFGGAPPLELEAISAFLATQIARANALYGAFKTLVREHEAAIKSTEERSSGQ